jgi:hypothetical protein
MDSFPRNRQPEQLPAPFVEIVHAGGTIRLDHNALIMAFFSSSGDQSAYGWMPIEGSSSIIDGNPSVIYRSDDVEISLTVEQVAALAGTELDPNEFRILHDRYGSFFEIHDDFYDEVTGEAFQPKELRGLYLRMSNPTVSPKP